MLSEAPLLLNTCIPGDEMTSPSGQKVQRRLAAILAADIAGFSALMGQDEEGTLARIKTLRRDVIEPKVSDHQGRVVKTTGDGFLVEFSSPVEAVRCAVEVQAALASEATHGGLRPSNSASASISETSSLKAMAISTAME